MARLAAYPELLKTIKPQRAHAAQDYANMDDTDSVAILCNLIQELAAAEDENRYADYIRLKKRLKRYLFTTGIASPQKRRHNTDHPNQNDRYCDYGSLKGTRTGVRTVEECVGGHADRVPEFGPSLNAAENRFGSPELEKRGVPWPGHHSAGTAKHTDDPEAQ
jgi:hypothetical protein